MKSNQKQQAIENIMSNFDFDMVHTAMTVLNWTWAAAQGVPPIEMIKERARQLLTEAASMHEDSEVETGGLCAGKYGNELFLKFTLEEWAYYLE